MITCEFAVLGALADQGRLRKWSVKTVVRIATYFVQATAH